MTILQRNLIATPILALIAIGLVPASPSPHLNEAHILCSNDAPPVAVLADMQSCVAKTRAVAEWAYCGCSTPPNPWNRLYWLFAAPLVVAIGAALMLRGPIWAQGLLVVGATITATAALLIYDYARGYLEGAPYLVVGGAYITGVSVVAFFALRGAIYGAHQSRRT